MVTEETASPWPVRTLEAALGSFFWGLETVPVGRKKAGIITDYWRETAEDDSESCREQPARVVVTKKGGNAALPEWRRGGAGANGTGGNRP